jgi:hypothetical protein
MKAKITDFIHHLLVYDYLLFGGIFILFILLLALAIALRNKIVLAVFMVFFAFGVLTAGPLFGYILLHQHLFKHTIVIREIKALEFTEALLIKGDINNTSKRPFQECTLHAGVYKVTHNPYVDKLYPYFPFKKSSLKLTETIGAGKSAPFKLFVEPFRYTKDYNVTLKAECR